LLTLVALLGLNGFFLFDTNIITSDEPFLAFLYLAFFLMEKARDPDRPLGRRTLWGVALGAAMYLAYGSRTPGVLLVPALLAADLWQTRRIARPSLAAVAVFALLAGLQSFLLHSDRFYLDQLGMDPRVLLAHAVGYASRWAAFFSNGYSKAAAAALFAAVMVLALVGFARRVRQGGSAWEIFAVLYLGVILVWPSYEGERYLYPILPLWLFYAFTGAMSTLRSRAGRIVGAVLAVAIAVSYAGRWATLDFRPLDEGVTSPNAVAMLEHIRRNTGADDVIVFIKPRAMALLTGRPASVYHAAETDEQLRQYFRKIGAKYLGARRTRRCVCTFGS